MGAVGDPLSAAILALSPIMYLRLGEASGVTAEDEIGGGDGTYRNTPTLGQTGVPGADGNTAAAFESGSSQYVDFARTDLGSLSAITVVTFLKKSSASARERVASNWNDNIAAKRAWLMTYNASSKPTFAVHSGAALGTATDAVTATADSAFHMWTGAWDSAGDQKVRLYIDDGPETVGSAVASMGIGGDKPALMATWSDVVFQFFNTGTLDEVAIFDYELSNAERLSIHTASGI